MSSQESQEHRIKIDSLLKQLEQVVAEKGVQSESVHSTSQIHVRSNHSGRELEAGRPDSWRGARLRGGEEDPDESHDDDNMEDEADDDQESDRYATSHGPQDIGGSASAAQRSHEQVILWMGSTILRKAMIGCVPRPLLPYFNPS